MAAIVEPETTGQITALPSHGQALVYCRVSTKGQEQDGTSLDSQEAACVREVQALGYALGRVTKEIYSGAELWDRPLLARDRVDLKAGQFQALVTYSTDRLSRDPIHLAIIAEECERSGCALIFVTEPLDTSDEGKLLAYVKGYANKKEREKIRERSLRGKHQRALNGKVHNVGPELYGYRRDRARGVRLVDAPQAAVIRRIFDLVAVEHWSYYRIAAQFTAEGIPTPGAALLAARDPERNPVEWKADTVMRIVRNPVYKGEATIWQWKSQPLPPDRRLPSGRISKSQRSYRLVARPPEEQVRLPEGVVPAIVSAEVWQDAQDAVQRQCGDHTRNEHLPYLLRGRIACTQEGCDGRKMWASWRRRAGRNPASGKVRMYRCRHSVDAANIEAWAWGKVGEVLRHPEVIAAEIERRGEEGDDPVLGADLETARRELAKCERAQAQLVRRHTEHLMADPAENAFPWELVEREVKRLEGEKARWAAAVRQIEARLATHRRALAALEGLYTTCARVGAQLETFGFEQRRLALEALDVQVRVSATDWTITGWIPIDVPGGDAVVSQASPARRHRPDR
jgi:site-specific DNA recombinase